MAYPRKLLAPGEDIILETHPNWSILVPRTSLFLLVLAASVFLAVEWTKAPLWFGYVLLGVSGIFLLWVLGKVGTWRSTSLVLTNMRVVYRTGIVKRLGREIPLGRVQDVTYTQSIVERLVGAGSLTIQSAGIGGEDPFPDIRHPALVQSLINRLISQGPGGYGAPGQAPPQAPANTPVSPPYEPPAYPPSYENPRPQPQYPQPTQYPQATQYPPQGTQYPQGGQGQAAPTAPSPAPPMPTPQAYWAPPDAQQAYRPPYEEPATPPNPWPRPVPPPEPAAPQPAASPSSAGGDEADQLSSSEQLRRLGELLRLGVITQAEYDMKRQELLGGR